MPTESFYEIEAKIKRRIQPAAAVKVVILSDHQLRHPAHPWIFLAKPLRKAPMCRRTLFVEQPRSSNQTDTRTHTCYRSSTFMPALQPRNHLRISLNGILNAQPG